MYSPEAPRLDSAAHGLNPEQRRAVEHVKGPLLVLAGAGSGKTRVLTMRVARLIESHGVAPERILAVTFTNKAAGEMRERIRGLLGREPRGAWIGTFHSLGARILRRHAERLGWTSSFTIFDAEEGLREVKRTMKALGVDDKRHAPTAVRSIMSDAKNCLVAPAAFRREHGGGARLLLNAVASVYPAYQASLRAQNAFDFDDLLMKPVELFESDPPTLDAYRRRFEFLLVDEYQDTNRAQFRFLELVAGDGRNLMVVGDDDQSIYGWRGADIRNILDFEKTYPGAAVVRLETNYRSTRTILDAANSVVRVNRARKEKTLRTDKARGRPIDLTECGDEADEARWVVGRVEALRAEGALRGYRDVAVLYRTNAQSRVLEAVFRQREIPYQIAGGLRFYERREVQDVLAYLRLISNPRNAAAFLRAVNYPRRGVGASTLERLGRWAGEEGVTLLEAAGRAGSIAGISAGPARGLRRFAALISDYTARAAELPVGPLIGELVGELGLVRILRDEGPGGADRADNVSELVAGATNFQPDLGDEWDGAVPDHFTELDLFLQQVALVTELDRHDPESDLVTLMTLHNAKGLEFPCVFITGLEDGLFPFARAHAEPHLIEEERRLFYVGITRAKERLSISWARQRMRAGRRTVCQPSRFLRSLPNHLVAGGPAGPLERRPAASFATGGRGRAAPGPVRADGGGAGARLAGGGAWVEEAEVNQDLAPLVRGQRVVHRVFGSGTVLAVSGYGADATVTVDFDTVGRKKLVVRFAGLERDFP